MSITNTFLFCLMVGLISETTEFGINKSSYSVVYGLLVELLARFRILFRTVFYLV